MELQFHPSLEEIKYQKLMKIDDENKLRSEICKEVLLEGKRGTGYGF